MTSLLPPKIYNSWNSDMSVINDRWLQFLDFKFEAIPRPQMASVLCLRGAHGWSSEGENKEVDLTFSHFFSPLVIAGHIHSVHPPTPPEYTPPLQISKAEEEMIASLPFCGLSFSSREPLRFI